MVGLSVIDPKNQLVPVHRPPMLRVQIPMCPALDPPVPQAGSVAAVPNRSAQILAKLHEPGDFLQQFGEVVAKFPLFGRCGVVGLEVPIEERHRSPAGLQALPNSDVQFHVSCVFQRVPEGLVVHSINPADRVHQPLHGRDVRKDMLPVVRGHPRSVKRRIAFQFVQNRRGNPDRAGPPLHVDKHPVVRGAGHGSLRHRPRQARPLRRRPGGLPALSGLRTRQAKSRVQRAANLVCDLIGH